MTSQYDRRHAESGAPSAGAARSPGRRTLTQGLHGQARSDDSEGMGVDYLATGHPTSVPAADPYFFASAGGAAPAAQAVDAAARTGLGDVSGVRLHTDGPAQAVADAHQAHAVTFGQDIHFAGGAYEPGTEHGDRLLGHELAHTAQQRGATSAFATKARATTPGDASELEADVAGESFLAALGGREVAAVQVTPTPTAIARFATSPPPAPVRTQAPIGNQNAADVETMEDLVRGQHAAEGGRQRDAGRADQETPTLTIQPGGEPPGFVTSTNAAGQMTLGPTPDNPHNVVVPFVPRVFHAIPAILHDVQLITTPDELVTLWTLYLLDVPQPAPWLRRRLGRLIEDDPLTSARDGDHAAPGSAWVMPFDQMRLPSGAAAGQILRRLVRMHGPHDDAGGTARRNVLVAALTSRARDVEALQQLIPSAASGLSDPNDKTDAGQRPRPIPTLVLPAGKFAHFGLYQRMAGERRLIHDPEYERPDADQRATWIAEMAPGAPDGLTPGAHADGLDLLQRTARDSEELTIPNWSTLAPQAIMEVDHVVELQLVLPADHGWADSMPNYELLERGPNRSSGRLLDHNIAKERERLFELTGDRSYLTSRLYFEAVVPGGGATGGRWSQDQIRHGLHFRILRAKLGLQDPRFP